jgi:spore germination cell wall hydrolase CwlJ-like protein
MADDLLRLFMLALCVYREARGESPLGKALVAQTILNRSKDPKKRWPRTVTGVILQPLQFSSFNKSDPNVSVFPKEGEPAWVECVSAAQRALQANPPLTTANHYLTAALFNSPKRPSWASTGRILTTEDHHVFLEL